jgi:hypothetical protein
VSSPGWSEELASFYAKLVIDREGDNVEDWW